MSHRGGPYQKAVAALLRRMMPGATINEGKWVKGPDGRRDLDVSVRAWIQGVERRLLVECKDYNPRKTGPVGIGYVDALESKRRDLGVDGSLISSNAGFTRDAVNKAKRVGIGLFAVMSSGDRRIRFKVVDEVYVRHVNVKQLTIHLGDPNPLDLSGARFEQVLYDGQEVGNWILQKAALLLSANPILNCKITVDFHLTVPVPFQLPHGTVSATLLGYDITITGNWRAQQVTLDATNAAYDWINRRVRLAPGPGQVTFKNLDFDAGDVVSLPAEAELEGLKALKKGETAFGFLRVSGLDVRNPIPALDGLVAREDLDQVIPNLDLALCRSVDA